MYFSEAKEVSECNLNEMKAMIFAAGMGTRLQSETFHQPKALVEIGNKTLLQHAIEKVKSCNVSEIVINVHHFADQIIQFIDKHDFGIPIHISDEREKLLETGGGLKKAKKFLNDSSPILVYNVDVLSDINLDEVVNEHKSSGALATMVVRSRKTNRYLKFSSSKQLVGWGNSKSGETKISRPEYFDSAIKMAFSGIHIIDPEIFDYMPEADRFPIMELYLELAKTKTIKGFFDTSELWMDVGKPEQLKKARSLFK